jgi:hypothetical protein
MCHHARWILGVARVTGLSGLLILVSLSGWRAAWAQEPPIAEPASTSGIAAQWDALERWFTRSVDELSQREAWEQAAYWRIAVSPYTHHWRFSSEHRPVYALAVERHRDDGWLAGVSPFRNSFGQPSSYAYLGRRFDNLFGEPQLFGQFSAGILYGYKGRYKHKVPFNVRGFAPGALLSAGWRSQGGFSVTAHLLGDAGVMLQLAIDLP